LKEYLKRFMESKVEAATREGSEQVVIDLDDAQKFIEGLENLKK